MTQNVTKRTTVSLAGVVWEMAEERMEKKGFNGNFSAYVADLIREDKAQKQAASLTAAAGPIQASVDAHLAGKLQKIEAGNSNTQPPKSPSTVEIDR